MSGQGFLKIVAAALLAVVVAAPPASAATKINLLYIPGGDFVPAFVAKDQGIFDKHGLDVDMSIAQNGSVISAALAADQAQIGVPTPPVLLQANEQESISSSSPARRCYRFRRTPPV